MKDKDTINEKISSVFYTMNLTELRLKHLLN